ncbi:TetR/AcrR family transcriptional regulator [Bittarella massiliensis]|uniref:TetR/AcrR family transcriptional regulator n=1 Tax=Bittarella massiliensis (ex Durand et al. 2017) TaxID=1720313 RepID=UPI00163D0110|nr:TetR/AcrR family transcriptional regulator [Bittarella massiliensis (ex Durand et al. 2017)]MBC2870489.1 TetR/AcrR family transcriptional regulator [Bittarella massiliensis (ex Durand et al. 2017)]
MPRFSAGEREIIRQRLMREGERLFAAFGVKKVTVDEIVRATGIAKGTFYTFYPSKEHLYLDIAGNLQLQMWRDMDAFLKEHRALSPRALCKGCFLWMFDELQRYPMLRRADGETADYLYRKLPPEAIEAHTQDDRRELAKLEEFGIRFACGPEIATKALQTLAVAFLNLQQEEADSRQAVMEIILDGVLKELIVDEDH